MRAITDEELRRLVRDTFYAHDSRKEPSRGRLLLSEDRVLYCDIVLPKSCEVFFPPYGGQRSSGCAIIFPDGTGTSVTVHKKRPIAIRRVSGLCIAPRSMSSGMVGARL